MTKAIIYCDGSFDPNKKRGGYGVVALHKGIKEFYESSPDAYSSTRAELLGVIRAIEVYGPKVSHLQIFTDSKVIVECATYHINKWICQKWAKDIKNKDLWIRIHALMKQYLIDWVWVKSHNGNQYNDRADFLAKQSIGVNHGSII